MKKNEHKLTWEQLQQDDRVYMPDNRFSKAYNTTMRYIINKTNLQTAMFYYVLYSHYNSLDGSCFPDQETLAIECGVSTKTVQSMIKALRENEIIEYTSGKQGRCNSYKFPLEPNPKTTKGTVKKKKSIMLEDDENDPF